jgi:hypothetical protein
VSASILCHGCGQQAPVPDGYKFSRMRCPQCGVLCEVLAATPAKAGPEPSARPLTRPTEQRQPDPEEAAAELLAQELDRAAPPPPPTAQSRPHPTGPVIACQSCGELVRGPARKQRRSWRCPVCGAAAPPRETAVKAAPTPRPAALRPEPVPEPEIESSTNPDDSLPYPVGGGPVYRCPACHKILAPDAVVCTFCGLNLQTGEKAARTYERLQRSWMPGLPPRTRWTIFLIVQAGAVPLYGVMAWLEGGLISPLVAWLFLTVLGAFLLGTYDRITIARSERGKVRLTRQWRICFWARPERVISWRDYEGVVTGKTRETGCLDWFVMLFLLPLGIIPSLVWWYLFIYRDLYFMALARDHGFPELVLYRGYRAEQAVNMATTLRDTMELPWHKG